jgi:hypothetical protein
MLLDKLLAAEVGERPLVFVTHRYVLVASRSQALDMKPQGSLEWTIRIGFS